MRSRRDEDRNCSRRDELHRAGVNGEKGAHGIRRNARMRIQRLEIPHGAESERGGRVAEAEHVCRHVHQHRSHRRMIGRHVRKETAHDRAKRTRDALDESRRVPPRRMTPSHNAITPIKPSAMVTAVFAPSNAPSVTSFSRSFQPPIATARRTRASQM